MLFVQNNFDTDHMDHMEDNFDIGHIVDIGGFSLMDEALNKQLEVDLLVGRLKIWVYMGLASDLEKCLTSVVIPGV